MDKWYTHLYRRQLVDMHINDTKDFLLENFSADSYFKYLKKANIQSPMIYLQSHTGLCNFPTSVSKTHAFFLKKPNEIKKLIKLCHDDGMKVVGYYSLIFNNQAVKDHPEWEMINVDGTTWRDHGQRYGLCCPNNEEYKNFIVKQIKEIKEFYGEIDAIFYDMPYWEVTCHCKFCNDKWHQMYKENIPSTLDWHDQNWKNYVKARQVWMGEFTKFVKDKTNEIMPGKTVEFNFAAVIGCDWMAGSTELINESCEFTGGDLYGDLYNHSFTAKYYYGVSKNQPFEYMTCRCNMNLREHTISKNETMLEAEVLLTTLHHGASLIIDAINPDGTLDQRVAEKMGKVFEKQIPYEKYMGKGILYSDVAVYFDSRTQYSNNGLASNKECAINSVKTLIENHIPVSVVSNGNLSNLKNHKMVIAPSLDDFDDDKFECFVNYVESGGTLYLSGTSNKYLLEKFFNGKIKGFTFDDSKFKHVNKGYDEIQCYVYPTDKKYRVFFGEFNDKYPLPVTYKLPILEFSNGSIKAKIALPYTDPDNNNDFVSIHSNPPGPLTDMPAIVETKFGKGKVIYTAALLENDQRFNFKDIFISIIKDNVKPLFEINVSKYVESIIFKCEDGYILNLFDLNFANDVVTRKVSVMFDKNYEIYKLPEEKLISNGTESFNDTFEKYISYYLKEK